MFRLIEDLFHFLSKLNAFFVVLKVAGGERLTRGFSDTIYDFDGPLSSPASFATNSEVSPGMGGVSFDGLSKPSAIGCCPLAKEETFSSLELSEDSDENKVFDRGEVASDKAVTSSKQAKTFT